MSSFHLNFGNIPVDSLYCDKILHLKSYTKKCLLILGAPPPSVVTSSSPNTPRRSQPSRIPRPNSQVPTSANTVRTDSKTPRVIPSPNISRPTTPAVSRPSSRPVTPSFSQNAETINFFINFIEPDEE